jgi:hypothetical protein
MLNVVFAFIDVHCTVHCTVVGVGLTSTLARQSP